MSKDLILGHARFHPLFFGFNDSLRRMIEDFWEDSSPVVSPKFSYPPCNMKFDKKTGSAIIQLALAGFKKGDIQVQVKNNTLNISANKQERQDDKQQESYRICHNGIAARSFSQSFACTEEYQAQKAVISFQDGLLKISIPKDERIVKKLTIN